MKLSKAIKVNKDNKDYFQQEGFSECAEASRLGTEALKRIQYYRVVHPTHRERPLPSETKE